VPGCVGTPEAAKDYCFNPIKPTGPVAPAPTFAPVDPTPTPPGTTYRPGEKTVLMEGLSLSTGLSARKIATKNTRVQFANGGQSAEIFHSAPDGAAVFEDPATGNYVYASNSESSSDGGVGAIYFNAQGEVTGYQRLLFEDPNDSSQTSIDETSRNCGVGKTYWNTLITCEEWDGGRVWEVDPWGNTPGRVTNMVAEGRAYESAAYDNREENSPVFYITTDESNGPLVKYTPDPAVVAAAIASGDFSNVLHSGGGTYEYFVVTNGGSSGTYEWSTNLNNGNDSASVHHQNGEGIDIRDGKLYYTSKTQKLLYIIDLDGNSCKFIVQSSSDYHGAA
jgi:secreted PhoX family phosphatase